jgi:hypothetical protein
MNLLVVECSSSSISPLWIKKQVEVHGKGLSLVFEKGVYKWLLLVSLSFSLGCSDVDYACVQRIDEKRDTWSMGKGGMLGGWERGVT